MPSKKPKPAPAAGIAAYRKKPPATVDSQNDVSTSAPTNGRRELQLFGWSEPSSVCPPREVADSSRTHVAEHHNLSIATQHRKAVKTQNSTVKSQLPVETTAPSTATSSGAILSPETNRRLELLIAEFQALTTTTRTALSVAQPAVPSDRPTTADKKATVNLNAVKTFPPLIVEVLPNWVHHLQVLKEKLGRTLNCRAYGGGIRFLPKDKKEFRLVRSYLTTLENDKEHPIEWFTYGLPGEKCLKFAIRGLPSVTPPQDIKNELRWLGYKPKAVRCVLGRRGTCVFFAAMQHTKNLIPNIYAVTELLHVAGIKIETWRGKKKPAQCYRCQSFRHSSYNCHRRIACVICGEEHLAYNCPRPRDEPATCVNCSGLHPANYQRCPVRLREIKNKKAGTVALTVDERPLRDAVQQQQPAVVEETPSTSLIASAIESPPHASAVQEVKKKKKKKKGGHR